MEVGDSFVETLILASVTFSMNFYVYKGGEIEKGDISFFFEILKINAF